MPAPKGLSVVVLDSRAFGGQAGASARIENYLGFPTGISGMALAGRAFVQAQKFGAEIMIPVEVKSLDCTRRDGSFALDARRRRAHPRALGRDRQRRALSPAGDRQPRRIRGPRRLVLGLADRGAALRGRGGHPGRRRQFGRPGGGVLCRRMRRKVRMMVRGDGLAATMSRYLIDRIAAAPNIELLTAHRNRRARGRRQRPRARALAQPQDRRGSAGAIRNVFLFIGADPATGWLAGLRRRARHGRLRRHRRAMLERAIRTRCRSSVPGVFAVGDVRSGSVKRVGGGIGEGAQVVAALHALPLAPASPRLTEDDAMADAMHATPTRSAT